MPCRRAAARRDALLSPTTICIRFTSVWPAHPSCSVGRKGVFCMRKQSTYGETFVKLRQERAYVPMRPYFARRNGRRNHPAGAADRMPGGTTLAPGEVWTPCQGMGRGNTRANATLGLISPNLVQCSSEFRPFQCRVCQKVHLEIQ